MQSVQRSSRLSAFFKAWQWGLSSHLETKLDGGWKHRRVLGGRQCYRGFHGNVQLGGTLAPTFLGSRRPLSTAAPDVTHQRVKGRSRFYKKVGIRESVGQSGDCKRWEVLLDGRVLKTPARTLLQVCSNGSNCPGEAVFKGLVVSRDCTACCCARTALEGSVRTNPIPPPLAQQQFDTPELALSVAAEWDSQTARTGLEPALMPLMSLASTALDQWQQLSVHRPAAHFTGITDQVALDRERTIATCLKYLPTDTVCFLAPDPDPVVARKERQLWAPLRDWAAKELGIPLATTSEIFARPQHPDEALVRARELLESCDEWALAALQSVTMECKSLVIALALAYRNTTVEKAFEAARLEEEYNVERWGMIEGGHDMDRVNTKLTLASASILLWLRKVPLPKPKKTER